MKVITNSEINNKTIVLTTQKIHELNDLELSLLKDIKEKSDYPNRVGYKPTTDMLMDEKYNEAFYNIKVLQLIEEDPDAFSTTYFLTEFGDKVLENQ